MIDRGQDGPEPGPTKYKSSIGHLSNSRLIIICGVKTMSLIKILLLFWSTHTRMGTLKEVCQTEWFWDNLWGATLNRISDMDVILWRLKNELGHFVPNVEVYVYIGQKCLP